MKTIGDSTLNLGDQLVEAPCICILSLSGQMRLSGYYQLVKEIRSESEPFDTDLVILSAHRLIGMADLPKFRWSHVSNESQMGTEEQTEHCYTFP